MRDNRGKGFFQKLSDWLDSLLENEPEPTLSPKTQQFIEESLFVEQTTTQAKERIERQQLIERHQLEKSFLTTKPAQPEETSNMPRHRNYHNPNNKHRKPPNTPSQNLSTAELADDEKTSAARHAKNAAETRGEVSEGSESEDGAFFLQARRAQKTASEQASLLSLEKENRNTLLSEETDGRYDICIQSLSEISAIKKQEIARAVSKIEQTEASERATIEANFASQRTQLSKRMGKERIEMRNLMFLSKKHGAKPRTEEPSDFVVVEKQEPKQEPKQASASFFSIPSQTPAEKHVDPTKATAPTQGWADYFASFLPGRK